VYPFFKLIDRDNSGAIEFEEFESYILGKNWKKESDKGQEKLS
jgi:Ca2+-binding EF-hand superfamily protein